MGPTSETYGVYSRTKISMCIVRAKTMFMHIMCVLETYASMYLACTECVYTCMFRAYVTHVPACVVRPKNVVSYVCSARNKCLSIYATHTCCSRYMYVTNVFSPTCCLFYKSTNRTYYGRVEVGRCTAGPRGGAWLGRTGRRRVGSPRRQLFPLPSRASRASKTSVLNNFSKARTNEIIRKSNGGTR